MIALLFLGLFTVLGLAYVSLATTNLRQSSNHVRMQTARMQAESGLGYCEYLLNQAGNSHIVIDRSHFPNVPPGFAIPGKLVGLIITYVEY